MKKIVFFTVIVALLSCNVIKAQAIKTKKPNVLIILADDLGWGDVGFNGCTDIPTPTLDDLANQGVVFSAGYSSHPYCGPSRSGLMAGRYQQRFGCENNIGKDFDGPVPGVPLGEKMISEVLKDNGYQTCAIGKWHLGNVAEYWPNNRGFDDWFGFSGGSRNYWGKSWEENFSNWHRIMRDGKPEPRENLSYLTDDFTDAAVEYINEYSKNDKPFFMYLAYNAPHAPIQATSEYLKLTDHIEDGKRAAYGAMVAGMDVGIGKVIEKLKQSGEYENTLIFFYSDNGGHGNGTSQEPYRGQKGMLFEGGIRVPFLMSWPNKLKNGVQYDEPVIAYDIFTTILKAADVSCEKENLLDGVNLLPFVKEEKSNKVPHEKLFWRYSDGEGYAVRKGDYKLIKEVVRDDLFLFNIKNDSLEHHNLVEAMPVKVKELQAEYDKWNKDNVENHWPDKHIPNVLKTKKTREEIISKTSGGERNYK
ncbi:sulfatase family protein [Lutibacter citreus]|uniref:sulfatase family protein n=1 Tax=Lutibacter citreus TaxID=2138210 RepID=UPI000DBE945C|nr:sulfatase-like hydrolase/transferase [Lutibacter citreus]